MHTPKSQQKLPLFTTSSCSCKFAKGEIRSGDNFPRGYCTGGSLKKFFCQSKTIKILVKSYLKNSIKLLTVNPIIFQFKFF